MEMTMIADNEKHVPDCPYCEQRVDGETRIFGDSLMHRECYDQFGRDLLILDIEEELEAEEEEYVPTEGDIDYCYRSFYGF
jgi:hypothetical protein